MSDKIKKFGLDELLADVAEEQVDEVQILARGALNTTFALFRLTTMHALNNEAFEKPLQTLERVIEAYRSGGGSYALRRRGDSFFVNNTMIKLDSTSYTAAEYLGPVWEALGIGAINAIGRVGTEHIREMLADVVETKALPEGQRLGAMVDKRYGGLHIRSALSADDPLVELKRETKRTYSLLALARVEFAELGVKDRFPPLRRIKRLVQRLADLVRKNPSIVGSFSTNYGGAEHDRYHAINVAFISMVIGHRIKIKRRDITSLGIAALLHDMEMDDSPGNNSGKPVSEGVELLIRFKGLNESTLQWTVTADEMAMYSRYVLPRKKWYYGGESPGMFSKIITVAHRYERRINGTPERSVSPHTAILQSIQDARKECDPRIVKALISSFGLFPLGTLVQLNDGTKVVVVKNYKEAEMATFPAVRPIPGHCGPLDPEVVIELGDPGVRARIAAPVQPSQLRINPIAEILV
jgi:hypothetical protein